MAWTGSKVFARTVSDMLDNIAAFDFGSDVPKVALYNNTPTPDNTVVSASTAYNVGQWATANEVFQAGQWAQGGVALSGTSLTVGASATTYDANDTASGSAATLANVFGVQVYDDTLTTPVADQGVCYNYLGGANSVTGGSFTVVWNSLGIFRATY